MDVSEGAATFHRLALDRRKQLLGAGFVVLVAIIWVTFSFVVKEVEGQGLHPFLLSYIANSLFVVYLPLHWAVQRSKASKLAKPRCAGEVLLQASPLSGPRDLVGCCSILSTAEVKVAGHRSQQMRRYQEDKATLWPSCQTMHNPQQTSANWTRSHRLLPAPLLQLLWYVQSRACMSFTLPLTKGCMTTHHIDRAGRFACYATWRVKGRFQLQASVSPSTAACACVMHKQCPYAPKKSASGAKSWHPDAARQDCPLTQTPSDLRLLTGGPTVVPGPAELQFQPGPDQRDLQHHPQLHLQPVHLCCSHSAAPGRVPAAEGGGHRALHGRHALLLDCSMLLVGAALVQL